MTAEDVKTFFHVKATKTEEEKLNEKIKDGRSGPIIVLLMFIAIVNDVPTLVTVDMRF